ncbi:MAG TPA: DUF1499 domain-containing protein [Rhizomicrobium sp.]|nr:DUF1499 domain-containing protein [Rhizomicrobium sp.]
MRHQPLLAKISFALLLIGGLIALAACLGTRLHIWDYAFGVKVLTPGVGIGGVALLFGVAWIWRALAMNNSLGWRLGGIGLIGSAILTGIPANYVWHCYTLPPIHDISTDIGDAPKFHTLLSWRRGAPNPPGYDGPRIVVYDGEKMTTALAQKNTWPDIKSLPEMDNRVPQKELVDKYFWRALNAVNAEGWQVASFDVKKGRIEATDTTLFFGNVSDIVIRVRPAGAIGVLIDIRAKSRIGECDGGRNAGQIREFLSRERGQ